MPHNGISFLDHWHNLAKAITDERDEKKQRELVKQLSASYQDEMVEQSIRRDMN
jgi:hypothetical protein